MTDRSPAPAPIVFLDVETTGLGPDDEIWEIAGVRREPDGTHSELHLFVEHDDHKCYHLPEAFRVDHAARFPSACSGRVTTRNTAAVEISRFLRVADGDPRAVVVGINPGFDLGHITRLIATHRPGFDSAPWDYTPVDARHLAVGALLAAPLFVNTGHAAGRPTTEVRVGVRHGLQVLTEQAEVGRTPSGPPWGSEDVSRALGINPDDFERHTAMGDVLWAMAIYDAAVGTPPAEDTQRAERILRRVTAIYQEGVTGGDTETIYSHPEDTLDAIWDALNEQGSKRPPAEDTHTDVTGHDFLPVNGHPDDDECTHRADGTDATYCGEPRDAHTPPAEDTHTDVTEQAMQIAKASLLEHLVDHDAEDEAWNIANTMQAAGLLATAPTTTERPCEHGGALYRKFDGGRSAILCERCNRILGYMPPDTAPTATVTTQQRDAVADALGDQTVGVAKSVMRGTVADAFAAAGIEAE